MVVLVPMQGHPSSDFRELFENEEGGLGVLGAVVGGVVEDRAASRSSLVIEVEGGVSVSVGKGHRHDAKAAAKTGAVYRLVSLEVMLAVIGVMLQQ